MKQSKNLSSPQTCLRGMKRFGDRGIYISRLGLNWVCFGFVLGSFFGQIFVFGLKTGGIGFVLHKKVYFSYVLFRRIGIQATDFTGHTEKKHKN